MAEDWQAALTDQQPRLREITKFLEREAADGRGYLPAPDHVLRALQMPMAQVRVLIVGQDPYPTPGHAMGLAFSVHRECLPVPRSLTNIFREYETDLGFPSPVTGDLTRWSEQGVLLLNRVLTVSPGTPGSHRGRGWEEFTAAAIDALIARGGPLVAVLWGSDAAGIRPRLANVPVIASAHPSPLSAHRGFFGSRPFSRANAALVEQDSNPIDWRL